LVSIPVNTKAEVFVPSTAASLSMNGEELPAVEKVNEEGTGYHFLKVKVGSGNYRFTSPFKIPE
jgi:hypothetical protein